MKKTDLASKLSYENRKVERVVPILNIFNHSRPVGTIIMDSGIVELQYARISIHFLALETRKLAYRAARAFRVEVLDPSLSIRRRRRHRSH